MKLLSWGKNHKESETVEGCHVSGRIGISIDLFGFVYSDVSSELSAAWCAFLIYEIKLFFLVINEYR